MPEDYRGDLTKGDLFAGAPPGTVQATGVLHRYQYQTGSDAYGLIGLYPTPQVLHLYIMGDTSQTMTTRLQAAELAMDANYPQAYWETHYREGNAAKPYLSRYLDPSQSTLAFGRPLSLDARPTFTSLLPQTGWSSAADQVTVVGPIRQYDSGSGNPSANAP